MGPNPRDQPLSDMHDIKAPALAPSFRSRLLDSDEAFASDFFPQDRPFRPFVHAPCDDAVESDDRRFM
jgi:hypothetical protein